MKKIFFCNTNQATGFSMIRTSTERRNISFWAVDKDVIKYVIIEIERKFSVTKYPTFFTLQLPIKTQE